MKHLFIALLSLAMATPALAKDMSDTESYEEAYGRSEDGRSAYVGSCSTHEHYEGEYFKPSKTLIPYVEGWDLRKETIEDVDKIIAKLPIELWRALLEDQVPGFDKIDSPLFTTESIVREFIISVDDITVKSIKHNLLPGKELIQFNIGVGGGNGGFSTYMRMADKTIPNPHGMKKPITRKVYERVSETFDGDLNFCSDKVWLPNLE